MKDGSLRLKGKGGALYSLAGAPQGTVTVRLQLGNGAMLCAIAPAKDPATSNDTTAKFTGEITIRIDDDGVGFTSGAPAPWAIASRAAELGGSVRVGDHPGGHVTVLLPAA